MGRKYFRIKMNDRPSLARCKQDLQQNSKFSIHLKPNKLTELKSISQHPSNLNNITGQRTIA